MKRILVCGAGGFIGGQRTRYDYHNMVFNKRLLASSLGEIGFSNIQEWGWRDTIHSKIDDYNQAYLPHMDKENGILMSLNLEGTK
jgi:hypothetical protein